MAQYVYCLSNPDYITNLYKIGFTQKNPKVRANELYSTGVPSEFTIEFIIETPDGKLLEKLIHDKLKKYRINKNREFFKIPMMSLKNIIENELQLKLILDIKKFNEDFNDSNDTNIVPANETQEDMNLFICEKCFNGFKSKQNLQKHVRNSVCLKKELIDNITFNDKQNFILLSIEKLKK